MEYYGMTLVPGGAFIMGKSDDDLADIQDAPTKTVTVRSFYMDRNHQQRVPKVCSG
jgi:formylglycine-generating enzyme required for sulfatase activity